MRIVKKIRIQITLLVIWGIYVSYLLFIEHLLIFHEIGQAIIAPIVIQVIIYSVFYIMLSKPYQFINYITAILCCLLTISWNYNMYHFVSNKLVMALFLIGPFLITGIDYFRKKHNNENAKSDISSSFGIACLLSFLYFIAMLISFYILYYFIT